MTRQRHLTLASVAFATWLVFYLLGAPFNYYQTWSVEGLVLLSLLACFAFIPLIGAIVLILLDGDYVRTSLWFAFYGSVLLFALDFIVVGLVQGHGIGDLASHWYLTLGYLYVWIEFPIVGLVLNKARVTLTAQ